MKVALKTILLLLVAGYLIFAIVRFSQRTEERVCEAVDIQITDSLEGGFVTTDYIHSILTKNKVYAEGKKLSSIDIQGLEEILQKDPYIDSARCYCSAASHLCIYIIPIPNNYINRHCNRHNKWHLNLITNPNRINNRRNQ